MAENCIRLVLCKRFSLSFGLLLWMLNVSAQNTPPVRFTVTQNQLNDSTLMVILKAKVNKGMILYAQQRQGDDVFYSSIRFDSALSSKMNGRPVETGNIKSERDPVIGNLVHYVTDSIEWRQSMRIGRYDSLVVKGEVAYAYRIDDQYLSGGETFRIFHRSEIVESGSTIAKRSSWWIFLGAFGGGLLALLTPCVYSMIPVTVSFFTTRSKTKKQGIRNAFYYSTSIILIFTLVGFAVTLIFGPAALNNLATNWIANLVFFILFLLFGFSFLGAFEISLPNKWSNKADNKAGTGGFMGIFFMALTLVLVSFSCTGPIIGNLLVLAAKGSYLGPLIGMFGFSLALAMPFALFAFFPGKLNVLGKSGGWLNAVKVTLGFLELALALKFFSNADLAKQWRILDREVFLAVWITLFIILGLYLLGKIRFHHDDELPKNDFGVPYVSVTRISLVIACFAFSLYMMPGLFGAPLKGISAFVPPMGTQDFTIKVNESGDRGSVSVRATVNDLQPVKYADRMKIYDPEVVAKYGLITYYDYEEALAVARRLHKPLMLDFTGINCVNCRKMEGQVWSDPEVMRRLKEDFVIVSLYVDVQNIDLDEKEQYFSKDLDKKIETLGDFNADMQVRRFGANTQPYYFFLDGNERKLISDGYGYNPSVAKFIAHLEKVMQAVRKEN